MVRPRALGAPGGVDLRDGRNAELGAVAALRDPGLPVTVAPVPTGAEEQEALDAAFRVKYAHSPYGDSILAAGPKSLTLRVESTAQSGRCLQVSRGGSSSRRAGSARTTGRGSL